MKRPIPENGCLVKPEHFRITQRYPDNWRQLVQAGCPHANQLGFGDCPWARSTQEVQAATDQQAQEIAAQTTRRDCTHNR